LCTPIIYNSDISSNLMSVSGINLTATAPNAIAYPCGLIAKSYFNDSYNLTSVESGQNITLN